ncbi:MAG: hypothetical protein K0R05_3609 [Anaerocolumna sp.]|jgi:hypothetical protein|nr:hypothetical protein [Anaerocolumna sp.]
MGLKKLSMFEKFDFVAFSKDKRFASTGFSDWNDYETKVHKGVKIEAVILEDKSDYHCKPDEEVNNLYEKIVIKVPKDIKVPVGVEIRPVNVQASVYGEFRNLLSVVAQDIEILKH